MELGEKMIKKKMFFFVFLFLLTFVNAQVQTDSPVRTDTCADIIQLCSNCTYVNISILQQPDKSKITINSEMQDLGQNFYNYTFCNNSINGEVIVNGVADPNGVETVWNYNYFVNPLGKILTNSQAILYFLVFFVAFIFFILAVISGVYMPSKNSRDQMTGYILVVENLKYLRMFLFAVAYLLLMLMSYFGWVISYGYLDLDAIGNLFNYGFYFLLLALFPLFAVSMYVVIVNLVRDAKVGQMLQRGLRVK
jgi:hypothetical protein